jgi:splicing factor 1
LDSMYYGAGAGAPPPPPPGDGPPPPVSTCFPLFYDNY